MRSIFVYLLLSFTGLNVNAQFFDYDNTSGIYEDKTNEFVYVYGLTAERNIFMNKYDANFNLLKEYIGRRIIGKREGCYFFMTGYIKKIMLFGGEPDSEPFIYIDTELEEIEPVISGEDMNGYAAKFNQGKLDYFAHFQSTDEALSKNNKKEKKEAYMGDMRIVCTETLSPNIETKWMKYIPVKGISNMIIHNVEDDVMHFSTKIEGNSVNLYEYNIETEEIVLTKSIVNPSKGEITTQNVTYDTYRDRYYVSFVENVFARNDYSSKVRVYTLNNQFELEKEVIELFNEYPKGDCKKGKLDFHIRNNRPYVNVTKDMVNIGVQHTVNVKYSATAGVFYRALLIGLTDIIITDEKVEMYFHNKQTIADQRTLYSDSKKIPNQDFALDMNYYSKVYIDGVAYYVLDKKTFKEIMGKSHMTN
jgi:hypothetical protein